MLHASPSLPNLNASAQRTTEHHHAVRPRLGPLDLAPSSSPSPSTAASTGGAHAERTRLTTPDPSPRLKQSSALPLTPPLTPSSSLDGQQTIPEPSTPVEDPPPSSPLSARRVAHLEKRLSIINLSGDVCERLSVSTDDSNDEQEDRTPTECPRRISPTTGTNLFRYIDRATPVSPTRFLLVRF
jgi:hypothetical protein